MAMDFWEIKQTWSALTVNTSGWDPLRGQDGFPSGISDQNVECGVEEGKILPDGFGEAETSF